MLGDDQLRRVERFLPGVFIIFLLIQKHYDVRVLFQRAAFPQVAEQGCAARLLASTGGDFWTAKCGKIEIDKRSGTGK